MAKPNNKWLTLDVLDWLELQMWAPLIRRYYHLPRPDGGYDGVERFEDGED